MRQFGNPKVTDADPQENPVLQWPAGRIISWDTPYPNFVAVDGTYYTASIQSYITLVQRAFDLWHAVSGLTFASRIGTISPTADIEIGFDKIKPPPEHPKNLVYGYTDRTPKVGPPALFSQEIIQIEDPNALPLTSLEDGDSQYNVVVNGLFGGPPHIYTLQHATLFNTIVHEIGHALGLGHNMNDPFAIMYTKENEPYNPAINSIDMDDVATIQKLYPKVGLLDPLLLTQRDSTAPQAIGNTYGTYFNQFEVTDIRGLGMSVKITQQGPPGGMFSDNSSFAKNNLDTTNPDSANPWSFNATTGVFTETGVDAIPGNINYVTNIFTNLIYTPPKSGGTEKFTITVTDSLGRTASATKTLIINPAPDYHAPASPSATPTGSTAALPTSAAVVDPNVVTIPLGSLTATVSPSMQFLSSASPLAGDVQALEASSSITDFGAGLKTLFADVKAADLTAAWSDMSAPQPSQTLTITDHGNAVLSLNLSGATNDPTVTSALTLLKSFSV